MKRARRFRRLALACWSLALIAVGAWAGARAYTRLDDNNEGPVAVQVQTEVADEELAGQADIIVPDLYGLSESEAREALVDAGLPPDSVEVITVPAVGPAGRVVIQTPSKGGRNPAAAVIGLSSAATVPDVVGGSVEDARDGLELIGARVIADERYDPEATVGNVLSVEPAAGQTASDTVTIIVAAAPSAAFAADVSTVSSDCSDRSATVAGVAYDGTLVCTVRPDDEPDVIEYQVNGIVDEVKATVGLADGESAATLRFRVLAEDGQVIWSQDVASGATADLAVRTTGVQRLVFEASVVGAPEISSTSAAWGNLSFIGSADAMQGLANS